MCLHDSCRQIQCLYAVLPEPPPEQTQPPVLLPRTAWRHSSCCRLIGSCCSHAAVRLQRHHQPAALHPLHFLSWGGRQRPARYAYSTCLFVCVCSYAMRATVKRGIPVMHVSLCDCCSCWPCLKQCCTAYRCCRALSAPPSLSLPACRICNAYRHL